MLVYLDETGTPNRGNADERFPVFGVSAVIVPEVGQAQLIAALNAFKLRYWPHEGVVLHSSEINKKEGPFGMLRDAGRLRGFIEQLNAVLAADYYQAILVGMRKQAYYDRYGARAAAPYELCLALLLERLGHMARAQGSRTFRLIAESRGRQEDAALDACFRQLAAGDVGSLHWLHPEHWQGVAFELDFQAKRANIAGLQVADLIAYALAQHLLDPAKANPALQNLCEHDRLYGGWNYGLKVY